MGEDTADVSGTQDNTPLSVSFHDSAFMQFINEETERKDSTPIHRGARKQSSRKQQPVTPRRNAQHEATTPLKQQTTPHRQLQLGRQTSPHSVTPRSTEPHNTRQAVPLTINSAQELDDDNDNDDDWDDLDSIVLDSQTMRQVEESEEQFYATQQFEIPAHESLSQEFADNAALHSSRYASGPGSVDLESRNARRVPAHAARSAPTTPTASHSGAAAPTTLVTIAGSSSADARKRGSGYGQSRSNSANTAPSPTFVATQRSQQQDFRQDPGFASSTQLPQHKKSKVNLYSRLAQHIPAQTNLSFSSQRPPHPRLSAGNNLQKPWQRPPPLRSDDHHLQSSSLVTAGGNQRRMDPEMVQMMDDLERLRAENRQILAETEQLRSKLYTKEGEVRIVRENLARTEVENTNLQEQLANQVANVNTEQAKAQK
ncbi:hypothetical protein FBU59_002638, partial [Linderina macrospora]